MSLFFRLFIFALLFYRILPVCFKPFFFYLCQDTVQNPGLTIRIADFRGSGAAYFN